MLKSARMSDQMTSLLMRTREKEFEGVKKEYEYIRKKLEVCNEFGIVNDKKYTVEYLDKKFHECEKAVQAEVATKERLEAQIQVEEKKCDHTKLYLEYQKVTHKKGNCPHINCNCKDRRVVKTVRIQK